MKKPLITPEIKKLADAFVPPKELGFGKSLVPFMIEAKYAAGAWGESFFKPYENLRVDPAAKVFHYAQEIFEGLKAYKNEKGEIYLFRPEMNAARFNQSAKRLAMPEFPEQAFLDSVAAFAKAMEKHAPTGMNRSLYLRPFMIATEPTLGVRAATEYSYYLIGCLVESYFSRPNVKVLVEENDCRAAPGGVGFAKTGANYGASLLAYEKTKKAGMDQTLWLDAVNKRYVEELSGMNFFALKGDKLITPPLSDTILAGVTRDSILKMAKEFGVSPEEEKIDINDLTRWIDSGECQEAFACGTASVLTPIECVSYRGKVHELKREKGELSLRIKEHLLKLQRGLVPDPHHWARRVV